MKKLYTTLFMAVAAIAASAQITLQKPETKLATDITSTAFTANWGAVKDADGYAVFVYDRKPVTADGEVTIADEDFSGITQGSLNEPLGGEEEFVDLSAYGYALSYGWGAYAFPNFIPSMVAGLIYSPYLDLRADDGKYKVIIDAYCSDGDEIRVESHGVNVMVGGNEAVGSVNEVTNDSVTSCRITSLAKYTNSKVVYYDLYASADDFSTPNGSMPYTFVVSPFTDLVKVDLTARTSEIYNPETDGIDKVKTDAAEKVKDDVWYNLAGQRVSRPTNGLYICNGRKVVVR